MNYTNEQIMDSVVGSPTMTNALCNVIRGAIAQARSPFNPDIREHALSDALAFAMFLPKSDRVLIQERAA